MGQPLIHLSEKKNKKNGRVGYLRVHGTSEIYMYVCFVGKGYDWLCKDLLGRV